MAYAPDARSLSDLFAELTREIGTLVRNEMALARAEMSHKLSRVLGHVGAVVAGGAVALAGVFTLAAFLVLVLVEAGLPGWGASLIVGIGLAAIGALVAMRAVAALREENLTPTETLETLKETTAWKSQTN